MTFGFVVIDGRRLVGVTHDGDGGYWWHFEDRVRDYNGERGDVPTGFSSWPMAHWEEARGIRLRQEKLWALAGRPRRPPTGRGLFARGTFRVRL